MARKPSESELMIQLLGYGILTPTFTLLVHPWVHTLAGNQTTLYVPPEACALVGTIVSSEGIPLNFPPSNNLSPVQVDTITDPPQPRHLSDTDEWSREVVSGSYQAFDGDGSSAAVLFFVGEGVPSM